MSDENIRLRLFLRLETTAEEDDYPDLFADVKRVEAMVEAILSAPPLEAVSMIKIDDRKPKKVTAKTRAKLAATKKEALVEFFDESEPDHAAWAEFDMRPGLITLRSVVEGAELQKHRASALDDLITAMVSAVEVWRGLTVMSRGSIKLEYVGSSGPRYARLRKPRVAGRFPERSLVTFLDLRCAASAADVEALTKPKPAHATITKHGDLIGVRWTKTLDDAAVAQASTWHDCWIRRIATDRDDMFNDLGDERVVPGNGKPRPPLDFYNPWWKRAFKAVPVGANGELDKAALDEACKVLKAGAIANEQGEEERIEKMWIVVPTREQAIAVHDRVVAAGFEAAVYPGEGRRADYWDPVPKGPWLTESTDNGPVHAP